MTPPTDTPTDITPRERENRLVTRLGFEVSRGAVVEEHQRFFAIVRTVVPALDWRSLVIVASGFVLWLVVGGAMFLLAALVSLAGLVARAANPQHRRTMLRVDEDGKVLTRAM